MSVLFLKCVALDSIIHRFNKKSTCDASAFCGFIVQKCNYLKISILPHSVNGMHPVALKNIHRCFNIIKRCLGVGKRIEHTESFIS